MKRLFIPTHIFCFVSLFTSGLGCGDLPGGANLEGEEFGLTAESDWTETGGAGADSVSSDAGGLDSDGEGFEPADEGGEESGCADTGTLEPEEQLAPGQGSGGEGTDRPAAGACFNGNEVIAACLESNPLMFDCNPALIASCEAAGFSFVEMDPDEVPVDWDCDDFNDWLPDCTGGWLTDCENIGGSIDCHNEVGDICYEATCEAPEPG